jgi:CheY-like chemotaxis protein
MRSREDLPSIDVLIAEDDDLLRRDVRLLLEGQGYHCAEAADGPAAVALALRNPPRCVLLDLAMPGLDGFAVARTLRADPRTRSTHIHCLTGLSGPGVDRQAREAGCERFLIKPVSPEALLEAVRPAAPLEVEGSRSGLTLAQAEQLLDWLQNQDCTPLRTTLGPDGVTVHYLCPAWLSLGLAPDRRHPAEGVSCELLEGGQPTLPARMVNLSAGGAGLLLPRPFAPGEVLSLRLGGRDGRCRWTAELRLTHCQGPSGGPWRAGGPFLRPLPPEVLAALLR